MRDTLNDYEAAISPLIDGTHEPLLEVDHDRGQALRPAYDDPADERSHRLRQLSAEIRRKCWNSPGLARDLAARADAAAAEIERVAGGIPSGPYPRWPVFYSCGSRCQEIA